MCPFCAYTQKMFFFVKNIQFKYQRIHFMPYFHFGRHCCDFRAIFQKKYKNLKILVSFTRGGRLANFSNFNFTVKYSYLTDRGAQNVIILLFHQFISSVHHVSKTNYIFFSTLLEIDVIGVFICEH